MKPVSEFGTDRHTADKLCCYCRTCANSKSRAYRDANLDTDRSRVRGGAQARRSANTTYWGKHNPYLEHPDGKKECRRKHGFLPVSAFSRHASRADGLRDLCRECANAAGETRDDKTAWSRLTKTRPPCVYCNEPSEQIDHVHPVSRRGRDIATNYLPACEHCNLSKGSKWLYDYLFDTDGRPEDEKPTHYQDWDAPFLLSLFHELEHSTDARP